MKYLLAAVGVWVSLLVVVPAMVLFNLMTAASGSASCRPLSDSTILIQNLPTRVGDYRGEQISNAAEIIQAGHDLGLDRYSITIGVMTAIGESSLINVDYGDSAGPDSRGLFQQRDNGAWGSYADRMDPHTAATNFFKALVKVPGYREMEPPSLAAHATQRNADPLHYVPSWEPAVQLVAALTGDDPTDPSPPVTDDDGLVWPVGEDAPRGAYYNQAGPYWSSGHHTGADFNPGAGKPVHAAHAGVVTESTDAGGAYGSTVVVSWKQGWRTWANRYAHLNRREVKVGDKVTAGDVVGDVGWTGNVVPKGPAGAHLHFELTVNGEHRDPVAWLDGKAVDPGPGAGGDSCERGSDADIPPVDREANAAAVRFALTQVGKPYNSAGSTGLDSYGCNGFAWRVWHEAGSKWPLMLANEQGTTGRWVTEIGEEEAAPGDLIVFWYANGTDTRAGVRWDHVGVVVDPAKHTYVHAANSRVGVVVGNWDGVDRKMGFARVHLK